MSRHSSLRISESFKARADSAAFYEAWVGAILARQGLTTTHYPFTLADETGRTLHSYAASHDLDVYDEEVLQTAEVEVKSVNLPFTTPDDYPFSGVLVCSQKSFLSKWEGESHIGSHFLMVSRTTGAILWLPQGSKVELGVDVLDKSRNELYKAVRAEKEQLRSLEQFVAHVKGTEASV